MTLEDLIEEMGATRVTWTPDQQASPQRSDIRAQLVNSSAIEPDEFDVGPAGLLTHKGEQVLIYIRDTNKDLHTVLNTPQDTSRFHIAECETIKMMRRDDRFERYVMTNRTDGRFEVDWHDRTNGKFGTVEAALKVCKNCLEKTHWKNYENYQPERVWEEFNIAEFLFEYAPVFQSHPKRRAEDVTHNHYALEWPNISKDYRKRRNWVCEDCGVDLSNHRNLLHCHHRSGVLSDNRDANLKALCMLCHAQQPMHGHLKVPLNHRQTIEALPPRNQSAAPAARPRTAARL